MKTITFRIFGLTIWTVEIMDWEPVEELEAGSEIYPERHDTSDRPDAEDGIVIFHGGTGAQD